MKRLAGRPFALLGINSDSDKEKLKEALLKENITWRSWWDGGTTGPLTTKWNITSWPTNYVLDAGGTIRYKNVYDQDLERAVNTLLKELEEPKRP